MEDLRKYNESSYYDSEDISKKLMSLVGLEDYQIENELTYSIYDLKAMAENPYNSDEWRILYNVLLKVAEFDI